MNPRKISILYYGNYGIFKVVNKEKIKRQCFFSGYFLLKKLNSKIAEIYINFQYVKC